MTQTFETGKIYCSYKNQRWFLVLDTKQEDFETIKIYQLNKNGDCYWCTYDIPNYSFEEIG